MKKLLAFTLAVLMMLSVASSAFAAPIGPATNEVRITDEVYFKSAEDGILYAVNSVPDHAFKPGDTIYFRVDVAAGTSTTTINKYKLYYDLSMGKNYVETSSGGAAVVKYKAYIAGTAGTKWQYKKADGGWVDASANTSAAAVSELTTHLATPANLNAYPGVTYRAGGSMVIKYSLTSGSVDFDAATLRATLEPTLVNGATYPTAYKTATTAYNATKDGSQNAYFATITSLTATPTFAEVSALVADYNGAGAANYTKGATTIVTNASDFTVDGSGTPSDEATVFALLKSQLNTTQYYFEPGDTTFAGTAHATLAAAKTAYTSTVSALSDAQFLTDLNTLGTTYYAVNDNERWQYGTGAFTTTRATAVAQVIADTANNTKQVPVPGTSSTSYEYFVALKTKVNSSTKYLDVVGDFGVYRTASAFKGGDKFSTGFSLVNAKVGEGNKQEGTISVNADEGYVVKFAADAGEVDIEFGTSGDLAMFTVNANNQGDLNLEYNTKFDSDVADDYSNANLDFINFINKPTFNRIGTLYLYTPEKGYYIYENVNGQLKEVDSTWDSSYSAYKIKTRTLGSYVISDKKLTLKDTSSSSTAPSSSAPSSSSTGGTGGGTGLKPNPGTGR